MLRFHQFDFCVPGKMESQGVQEQPINSALVVQLVTLTTIRHAFLFYSFVCRSVCSCLPLGPLSDDNTRTHTRRVQSKYVKRVASSWQSIVEVFIFVRSLLVQIIPHLACG